LQSAKWGFPAKLFWEEKPNLVCKVAKCEPTKQPQIPQSATMTANPHMNPKQPLTVHVHTLIAAEIKRGVQFCPMLAWVRQEPEKWRHEGWQESAKGNYVERIGAK
jgi:hypothetical protein